MTEQLPWLPAAAEDWRSEASVLREERDAYALWSGLQRLAKFRLDLVATGRLDRELGRAVASGLLTTEITGPELRVAVLGSSTLEHLLPSLRMAALRRGVRISTQAGHFGQYMADLLDPPPELRAFAPEFVLLALDGHHLCDLISRDGMDAVLDRVTACWSHARRQLRAGVVQQTSLPIFEDRFGSNEHRLGSSPAAVLEEWNRRLRARADSEGVDLLAIDRYVAWGGIDAWYDARLWGLAKQEVHPRLAPSWGELAVRPIAAQRGRSAKCLVLDLDHTLWAGGIGDDGVDGIEIGPGTPAGEAHLALQRFALDLRARGIVLAVCSKNDEANARLPFTERPEMLLALRDFAVFVANWQDKATNLRTIAERLRLGLDALVFVDDSPAERELVRRELPDVMVPELPEDPAGFVRTIARAGYFEGLRLTAEDRCRAECYANEAARALEQRSATTDLPGYLRSLRMELSARPFDEPGLRRIVQLANKTNQFNLTTLRLTDDEVRRRVNDPAELTLQCSLRDRFGEHGTVALLAGRLDPRGELLLDLWLMSCRVLGRRVEEACLHALAERARALGADRLTGVFRPSAKNAMVRDLFPRLGFTRAVESDGYGGERWTLTLAELGALTPELPVSLV